MAGVEPAVVRVGSLEPMQADPCARAAGIPIPRFPPQVLPNAGEEAHFHRTQEASASEDSFPEPLRQSRQAKLQPSLAPSPHRKYIPVAREPVARIALKRRARGIAREFEQEMRHFNKPRTWSPITSWAFFAGIIRSRMPRSASIVRSRSVTSTVPFIGVLS